MNRFTAIAGLLGILAGAAGARDLELIEGAYEAGLGNVIMPGSIAGSALFRTCATCDAIGLRVSGATVFQLSGRTLTFDDFALAVEDIRGSDGATQQTLVTIYYDLGTEVVTRISVMPPRD